MEEQEWHTDRFLRTKKIENLKKRNPNFSFAKCHVYQHICVKVWISLKLGFCGG